MLYFYADNRRNAWYNNIRKGFRPKAELYYRLQNAEETNQFR